MKSRNLFTYIYSRNLLQVKYVATALPEDSLHEDLQEIERELYLERMGITLMDGLSTTTEESYSSTLSTGNYISIC